MVKSHLVKSHFEKSHLENVSFRKCLIWITSHFENVPFEKKIKINYYLYTKN